jgi:hypothetical protein
MKANRITLAICFVALMCAVVSGCDEMIPTGERENKSGYEIVIIDSCEYIEVTFCPGCDNGYYSLTHKGNCKHCTSKYEHK